MSAISGKTTRSHPLLLACSMNATIFFRFPAKSPMRGSICTSAIRILSTSSPGPSPASNHSSVMFQGSSRWVTTKSSRSAPLPGRRQLLSAKCPARWKRPFLRRKRPSGRLSLHATTDRLARAIRTARREGIYGAKTVPVIPSASLPPRPLPRFAACFAQVGTLVRKRRGSMLYLVTLYWMIRLVVPSRRAACA